MVKEKPYKAKSVKGAEREVRMLRKQVKEMRALFEEAHADRVMFSQLAADGPAFWNPLEVFEAKKRRDEILRTWCRLKPDGSPL